jgi:periplasmic protein TonB
MKPLLLVLLFLVAFFYASSQEEKERAVGLHPKRIDTFAVADTVEQLIIDKQARFPADKMSLYISLMKSYRVPPEAQEITGRIWISFTVEANGQLTDIKVIKPLHPAHDAEILRIFGSMPSWEPARSKGKPVRSRLTLQLTIRNSPCLR